MAVRYVVKKKKVGFGTQKVEKFVAQNFITNNMNFKDLCEEVTKVGLVPSGAVKFVLDALIDTLNLNLRKGISIQMGDFGQFRPGLSSECQETEEEVDASTIRRLKIVFTPGYKFRDMLDDANIRKIELINEESTSGNGTPSEGGGDNGGNSGETPDPAA